MRIGRLVKSAVKYGPIVYPVVKKAMAKRKSAGKGKTRTTETRTVDPKERS